MAKILIIDDDDVMCDMLSEMVHDMEHDVRGSQRLDDGVQAANSEAFDIVFLDVRMPDGNGLDIIPKIKETPSSPEIIIITGLGDADGAELAINSGAWDYIEKTSSVKDMRLSLKRALEYREQKKQFKAPVVLKRENIIGNSQKINMCLDQVANAAFGDANVFISGETGTGKELFAQAIHRNSSREAKNFVVVDCATLPDSLVESMLFGHEKGSFTGADSSREGLVKHADGGTLFLDEVGELPLSLQKTFLRVLQERCFRPVGGKKEVKSDFRLVSATNCDLEEMVEKGQFREDLLFRLNTIKIHLPPLREREDDIRGIVRAHMTKICKISKKTEKGFSDDFFQTIEAYQWPGNIRELINTIENVLAEAHDDPTLFSRHLPTKVRAQAARRMVGRSSQPAPVQSELTPESRIPASMRDYMDVKKTEYLKELMTHVGGKVNKACKISGLSRARLYQLLKEYHISYRR